MRNVLNGAIVNRKLTVNIVVVIKNKKKITMSIHGECFDNGSSGRCNVWDCSKFSSGKCDMPEEVYSHCEDNLALDPELEDEIFDIYPQLIDYKIPKKETEMSKQKDALDIQRKDRAVAANMLHELVRSLTKVDKPKDMTFFDGNEEIVFCEITNIPVKVVYFENNGVRKTFVNASEAESSILKVLASEPFIKIFSKLNKKVSEIDTELGCENLSKMATKALFNG